MIAAGRTVPGFELVAVQSRSRDRAAAFATEVGAARGHATLDAVAADPEVDAVYIASPNSLHCEQAIAMLRAGKHVLCEKPIAANTREAGAMFAAARRSGRLLMEAYTTPFEPNFEVVAGAVAALGEVRRAVFSKDQYSSRYDLLKAGELPNAFNPLMAAGSLVDIGFYTVAPAIHLFGPPNRIRATGILLPTGVDGQGTLLLDYGSFEVVCLHSKITESPAWSHIQGEAATMSLDDCSVPTTVRLRDRAGRVHERSVPQSVHHMRYEIEHFIGCIHAGLTESPLHTPGRTLAVMSVLDEARRQVGVHFPADDPSIPATIA
jgi:predicted dehydrogenase